MYVANLKDLNLILSDEDGHWWIVDTNPAQYRLKPEDALRKYESTWNKRWNRIDSRKARLSFSFNECFDFSAGLRSL